VKLTCNAQKGTITDRKPDTEYPAKYTGFVLLNELLMATVYPVTKHTALN